ncbi:MAG: Ig-like domain repeat protein, partial [Microbacterium sp.]
MGKVLLVMLTRRTRRSLVALLAGVLAALGLYAVPAATAAPTSGPVDLRVYFGGPGDKAGETVSIHAAVKPVGVTGQVNVYPTGTVTFSVGDGVPKVVSPYGATEGFSYTIPSNDPFTVTATFHATGGWEDSTYTATFKPLTRPYWGPVVPTVASLGAGGLKLNLKFSASVKNALGQGIAGRQIIFTLFNRLPQV